MSDRDDFNELVDLNGNWDEGGDVCPDCDGGGGWIEHDDEDTNWGGTWVECERCEGTGRP